MKWSAAILVGLILVGCGDHSEPPIASSPPPEKAAPTDPWVLTCVEPRNSEPALLWNGLIGVRIGRNGAATNDGGMPLPAFAIDEYETKGEEKIKTLENPMSTRALFRVGTFSATLQPIEASDYLQQLDMRTGVLTTSWTQPVGTLKLKIESATVVDPQSRSVAQKWTFSANGQVHVDQQNDYFFLGRREDGCIVLPSGRYAAVQNEAEGGVPPGPDADQSKPASFGKVSWTIDATHPLTSEWSVRLDDLPRRLPLSAAAGADGRKVPPPPPGSVTYEQVERASQSVWAERWKTDIEIDGPVADQQAIRSFLFYLRSAIHPEGGMSISPFGLSNSQYFGHVFWDADTWVLPALALIDPKSAEAIIEYRGVREKAARENYQAWLKAGRPIGQGSLGPPSKSVTGWPGVMSPWESSVSGHETVPGPSRFEHHITGSVARAVKIANSLGFNPAYTDTVWIGREAAEFYLNRIQKGNDGLYDLKGTMSPDENHIGDNDLYTNLLAQEAIDDAMWKYPPQNRPKLRLPKDDKTFLTYDGDPIKGYKQAAAVLAIYPLQYPPAEKQAKAMMDRFADKVSKNGPAMTDSIHSIIWSRIGEKAKAYKAWQDSWVPFTRSPLLLFSEKRTKQTTYFTTGAAGSLQSVLYGFLGFRLDYVKEPGAAWATQLSTGGWLSIKPNLPSEWNSVKFKNFNVLGRRYTLTATRTAATVAPGE